MIGRLDGVAGVNGMKMIFFIAIVVLNSHAQQLLSGPARAPESRAVLRVDANLVLVPVTVTNNRGAVIPNLEPSNFILSEERRLQSIVSFSHETAPISLGILVDLSGSMAYKVARVHVALGALLDCLEPESVRIPHRVAEALRGVEAKPIGVDALELSRNAGTVSHARGGVRE